MPRNFGGEVMTTLEEFMEKYPNLPETSTLKKILASRPTEKSEAELRQIKREEKFGKDCARWMASQDRQKSAAVRIGGDF